MLLLASSIELSPFIILFTGLISRYNSVHVISVINRRVIVDQYA